MRELRRGNGGGQGGDEGGVAEDEDGEWEDLPSWDWASPGPLRVDIGGVGWWGMIGMNLYLFPSHPVSG